MEYMIGGDMKSLLGVYGFFEVSQIIKILFCFYLNKLLYSEIYFLYFTDFFLNTKAAPLKMFHFFPNIF